MIFPGPHSRLEPFSEPDLRITAEPADAAGDTDHLLGLVASMRLEERQILGYPGNLGRRFSHLGPALDVLFNNVGDCDSLDDASNVNTKRHEQAVIDFFAETAGASGPEVYGYVNSGGSDGLLRGLYTARQKLPHATIYVSDQGHYSVAKAAKILGMKLAIVPTGEDGTMDPDALRASAFIRRRLNPRGGRGPGAIVVSTIGTTMRGAYDDVITLRRQAEAAGEVYVHADAASGGLIAAHAPSAPPWNFSHGVDSLSISGHKTLGMPIPCGVILIRRELVPEAELADEYVSTSDRTLSCSRSGLAALLLWSALRQLGHDGLRAHILQCLQMAAYATDRLALAGVEPTRTPDSLTITFRRPAAWVIKRWHLACEGDTAHIITLSHVTADAIDELCQDLASDHTRPAVPLDRLSRS